MCHRSLVFISLCGIWASGCASNGDAGHDSVHTDSAGVEIVSNTSPDRTLSWSLNHRLTLGGADEGPESFYQLSRPLVSFDDEGSMFVLNRQAFQVAKFSPGGQFEFAIGGEGEGPGEFLRPRGVASAPNGSFYVFDSGKGRLLRFSRDGSAEDEVVAGSAGARLLAFDAALVTHHHRYFSDGYSEYLQLTEGSDTLLVAGTGLAQTRSFRYESCGFGMGITGPVIFAPELVWHGHKGGIAVNSEPGYVVNVFDEVGNLVRSVRRFDGARLATTELADVWAKANPVRVRRGTGECVVPSEEVVEKRGYAEYVPWVSDVAFAPGGTLWVQRYALPPDTSVIDVFDATGVYVGTLDPAFPFPMAFLPNGDFLISERDNLDVERLVIASLVTR